MKPIYYAVAVIFIAAALLTVYTNIPQENNFANKADEGTYFAYSKYIAENGIKNYPVLFANHMGDRNRWIWPSPLRVGYFLFSSSWFRFFGASFRALAQLSFFCYVLFLVISWYFSKKYFDKEIAVAFVLLLAFSPLAMAMAKRALSDSMGNLFIALAVWLFFNFLSNKRISDFVIFEFFYIYSILIREQSVLYICFFCLIFLIYNHAYGMNIPKIYFLLLIIVPVIGVGLIWLFAAQDPGNLILQLKLTRYLPTVNKYSVFFCRGPWFRYIVDYTLISPLIVILALSFIVYAFVGRETFKDYKLTYLPAFFLISYFLLSAFDFNKNVRYAMILDMAMRFFAVLMLKAIFKTSKSPNDHVFAGILILCVIDAFGFIDLFCLSNVYDPICYNLLKVQKFIP